MLVAATAEVADASGCGAPLNTRLSQEKNPPSDFATTGAATGAGAGAATT